MINKSSIKITLLILLLLSFGVISCSKKDNSHTIKPITANISINVFQMDSLRGSVRSPYRVGALIQVWREDNNNLIVKNYSEGGQGIGYDSVSNQKIPSRYSAVSADYLIINNVAPGKYFAYVVDVNNQNVGLPLYTYKHFEVTAGQTLNLSKTFVYPADTKYQPWL